MSTSVGIPQFRAFAGALVIALSFDQTQVHAAERSAVDVKTPACHVTEKALRTFLPTGPWRLVEDAPSASEAWRTEQVILQSFPEEVLTDDGWRWFRMDPRTGQAVASEAPSVAMARRFAGSKPVNGVRCKLVRDLAEANDARIRDRRQFRSMAPDSLSQRKHVTVHEAVLSPDGSEALVYISVSSGPEAGGGFLLLYRKLADATWMEVSRMGVWIS